MLTLKHFRL